ncbi:FMRFamide receptor-like [Lineus longissimus]|uniref:FMRFamide receptor-like n=1 Tax=Lineus longissimus TaxID=88925 RepID=UPI002B4D1093
MEGHKESSPGFAKGYLNMDSNSTMMYLPQASLPNLVTTLFDNMNLNATSAPSLLGSTDHSADRLLPSTDRSVPVFLKCLSGYRMKSFSSWRRYLRFTLHVPLMIIIGALGLAGNILSFLVIGRERPFTSTSILLRALAAADSIVLIGFILRNTLRRIHYYVVLINAYMEFYHLTLPYLKVLRGFGKTASILLTVSVAVERFIAVCKPLKAASKCTKRNAYFTVAGVSIVSFIYRLPIPFGYKVKYYYDPCAGRLRPKYATTDLYYNPIYYVGYVTLLALVMKAIFPIAILTVMTFRILRALRKSRNIDISSSGTQNKEASLATIRVMAVVIVFIVLELPEGLYQIIGVVRIFSPQSVESYWSDPTYYISRFLTQINCFINFFIYCATGRRFRRSVVEVFSKSCKKTTELRNT